MIETVEPIIVNLDVVLVQRNMRLNDSSDGVDITPQNQPGGRLEYRPGASPNEGFPMWGGPPGLPVPGAF